MQESAQTMNIHQETDPTVTHNIVAVQAHQITSPKMVTVRNVQMIRKQTQSSKEHVSDTDLIKLITFNRKILKTISRN
jgi:hypothetical protein